MSNNTIETCTAVLDICGKTIAVAISKHLVHDEAGDYIRSKCGTDPISWRRTDRFVRWSIVEAIVGHVDYRAHFPDSEDEDNQVKVAAAAHALTISLARHLANSTITYEKSRRSNHDMINVNLVDRTQSMWDLSEEPHLQKIRDKAREAAKLSDKGIGIYGEDVLTSYAGSMINVIFGWAISVEVKPVLRDFVGFKGHPVDYFAAINFYNYILGSLSVIRLTVDTTDAPEKIGRSSAIYGVMTDMWIEDSKVWATFTAASDASEPEWIASAKARFEEYRDIAEVSQVVAYLPWLSNPEAVKRRNLYYSYADSFRDNGLRNMTLIDADALRDCLEHQTAEEARGGSVTAGVPKYIRRNLKYTLNRLECTREITDIARNIWKSLMGTCGPSGGDLKLTKSPLDAMRNLVTQTLMRSENPTAVEFEGMIRDTHQAVEPESNVFSQTVGTSADPDNLVLYKLLAESIRVQGSEYLEKVFQE